MLWQVYNFHSQEPIIIVQEGPTKYADIGASCKIFDDLRANKYGEGASVRPHADPEDFGYRNVLPEELKPGFECLMVEDPHEHGAEWLRRGYVNGTTVQIDEVKQVDDINFVLYHCEGSNYPCFCPDTHFLNKPISHCGEETRYWVKIAN